MKNFLAIILNALFVALIWQNLYLPANPEETVWNQVLAVLVVILLAGLILMYLVKQEITINATFTLMIACATLLIAVIAARPVGKTLDAAVAFNDLQDESVAEILEVSKQVIGGELSIDQGEAELEARVRNQDFDSGKRALRRIVESPTADAVREVFPKIKLTQDQWNCEQLGCAYLGKQEVFTISTRQQIFSTLLILAIIGLVNFPSGRRQNI